MQACFTLDLTNQLIDIFIIKKNDFKVWFADQPTFDKTWLKTLGINEQNGNKPFLVPNQQGQLAKVIFLTEQVDGLWDLASLPTYLPAGSYRLNGLTQQQYETAACAWALALYKFNRYKKLKAPTCPILYLPKELELDLHAINTQIEATYLVRDLVTTPAEDMGPEDLSFATEQIAVKFGAQVNHIVGDSLLVENFPAIYVVGRGSARASRLIDMTWGEAHHPKVTLVGKGVCFDSGGYDLKNASSMRLMKKDMGGAATVLGLAAWIMASSLPIRLRVIIGAVENMISGQAFRPGDIVSTRKGLTVEIGNTDAEGRVVLADCLALAGEDKPELIIDFATLTGAGKIGLGPDIPSLFCNQEALANELQFLSRTCSDLVWSMPLYQPYREYIDSSIADISNDSSSPYAGALTAALFLKEFVDPTIAWVHLDIMAWNTKTRPGRPEGGEAQGMRTLYYYLQQRFKGN